MALVMNFTRSTYYLSFCEFGQPDLLYLSSDGEMLVWSTKDEKWVKVETDVYELELDYFWLQAGNMLVNEAGETITVEGVYGRVMVDTSLARWDLKAVQRWELQ